MKYAILLGLMTNFAMLTKATQNTNKAKSKEDPEDENTYISYDPKRSIKSVLGEYPGDFGSDLF
jgi:hypothetical protein